MTMLMTAADRVDPTVRRRLGTKAALAVTAVMTAVVGGSAAGAVWIFANGVRAQAETAGRQATVTAATAFATLAEPSAANIARTLDIALDDQLRAQAAATAFLIEAAEAAGHGRGYIEDALRQIAIRSPIRRIDVVDTNGSRYSTEEAGFAIANLEGAFQALAAGEPAGGTASTAAAQSASGLTKAAAAQTAEAGGVVRIEQVLDSTTASESYGGTNDQAARRLAERQAAAIAQLTTHAIELAEDAGWGRRTIEHRLEAIVENTTVEAIVAHGASNRVAYQAGRAESNPGNAAGQQPTARNGRSESGTRTLPGRYNEQRRWIAAAEASRANDRLRTTVELATRTGEGSLIESAWQAEANRLAGIEGVTGVWVAGVSDGEARLTAAAPEAGDDAGRDAWRRWGGRQEEMARQTAANGRARSDASIAILGRSTATVLSGAPAGDTGGATAAVAVVIESETSEIIQEMRRGTAGVLGAAVAMILITAVMTTWGARRWLTGPVERVASAARCLQAGERPPATLTSHLCRRDDEIGSLARSFDDMTEDVLARHEELQALVAARTQWLQQANDKLSEAHERVEQELALAKRVQESLAPREQGRCSLRDIVSNLAAQSCKLYHLGVGVVTRSSLARVNAEKPWEMYEELHGRLLGRCQAKAPGHGYRFKAKLFSVDSTTIDLCLSAFPWAKFRRTKGAVKVHVGLDHEGYLPTFVRVTNGKTSDIEAARALTLPKGSIVAADRAYVDFAWIDSLISEGIHLVTRLKRGIQYGVVETREVNAKRGVTSDETIEFTSAKGRKQCPHRLRRIGYHDRKTGKDYVFLTTHFHLSAKTIADIYKSRWQVELFFKWIKRTFTSRAGRWSCSSSGSSRT